jgi:hypothetical protein
MGRATVSLFGRVNRFIPTEGTTPRENRLTEAFAVILDRVDGLARTLALEWLGPGSPRDPRERCGKPAATPSLARLASWDQTWVEVATQVPSNERCVDLELRFGPHDRASVDDVRVWVEVKHGTDPDRGQLAAYHEKLAESGAVVLLAPGASLPYPTGGEVPATVPQRSWERVGQVCARLASSTSHEEVQQWLLQQFVVYLREEGLMGVEPIGPEHLTALAYSHQAEGALKVICGQAKGYVEQHWEGVPGGEDKPGIPYGVWYGWPRAPSGPADSFLDWVVARASGNQPIPHDGAVFFMAGLNVARGREFATSDHERAWQRALEEGKEIDGRLVSFQRWRGNHERLHRLAYPHEVLTGSTVAEQGTALGRWIVETFDLLGNPPIPFPQAH